MNNEQRMFLDIISDHLQSKKTVPQNNVDWHQIRQYAKSHQLEALIYHQIQEYYTNKQDLVNDVKQVEIVQMTCLVNYARNVHAYNEITNLFRLKHIRFFSVKGLEVASCYPIPAYRTMCDLDFVVYPKDKGKALKILKDIGYILIENNYGLQLRKQNSNLELDDHLLHRESLENGISRKFFDTCWKYVIAETNTGPLLDRSFHYTYLIEHTKKHFRTRGIGFRQFIDIAVFVQKNTDLNWEWIKSQLYSINLLEFAVLAHTFINKWWGLSSPFELKSIEDSFFDETTDYVFNSGVFGFDNVNQSLYVEEAYMNSDRGLCCFSPFVTFLKNTFIPYAKMIKLPYCSFVKDKKWLLPFGWVYRAVYIVINKRKQPKKNMASPSSQEIMDKHKRLMRKWGI